MYAADYACYEIVIRASPAGCGRERKYPAEPGADTEARLYRSRCRNRQTHPLTTCAGKTSSCSPASDGLLPTNLIPHVCSAQLADRVDQLGIYLGSHRCRGPDQENQDCLSIRANCHTPYPPPPPPPLPPPRQAHTNNNNRIKTKTKTKKQTNKQNKKTNIFLKNWDLCDKDLTRNLK